MSEIQTAPTPWSVMALDRGMGHIGPFFIADADGTIIAKDISEPLNAELIVNAVNERTAPISREAALVKALELAQKRIAFYGSISSLRHYDHDIREIQPVIDAALNSKSAA